MTTPNNDFGSQMKELEDITSWFESEELDLDKALVKFERGMEIAAKLRSRLKEVENRVQVIKRKFEAEAEAIATGEDQTPEPAPGAPELF